MDLKSEARSDVGRRRRAVPRQESGNQLVAEFATKEGVKTEEWPVGFVNATNGKFAAIADLAALENSRLSDEQKKSVEFVCRSRNQVVAVRGVAGAGKTTMLKALDRHLNEAGREMRRLQLQL